MQKRTIFALKVAVQHGADQKFQKYATFDVEKQLLSFSNEILSLALCSVRIPLGFHGLFAAQLYHHERLALFSKIQRDFTRLYEVRPSSLRLNVCSLEYSLEGKLRRPN